MEKYRKFEDLHNGINPFIQNKTKKRNALLKFLLIFQVIFGTAKSCLFIAVCSLLIIIQIIKHILIVSSVKRTIEIISNKIFGRVLLFLLGVWSLDYKFLKHDKQKTPNIIFSSQTCLIDWLILLYNYSPTFLWTIKSDDSKTDYFIELSYVDILFFGAGLRFLSTKGKTYSAYDINTIKSSVKPIVIFPECTKTNRNGILKIRSNTMDDTYDVINNNKDLLIRKEIYVKVCNYFNPINTTDQLGLRTLFWTICQVNNIVEIYSQDIPNITFDLETSVDKSKFSTINEQLDNNLQSYLMEPKNRNSVILSSTDHVAFLEYYKETNSDKSAKYVKEMIN